MWWQKLLGAKRRLIGAAFLLDVGILATALAVQFSGIALGVSPTILGLLGALSAGTYSLGCLISGRLSDRLDRRRTIGISLVLLAGVWALLGQAAVPWQLLILVTINGALLSLFWPSVTAWLAELTSGSDRALRQTMGTYNMAWAAGCVMGPAFAGALWAVAGPSSFYYTAVLLVVVVMLVGTTPTRRAAGVITATAQEPEVHHSRQEIRRFVVASRIAMFGGWFGYGVISTMFPKLGTLLGFSSTTIGIAISVFFVAMIILFGVARSTSRWQYRTWPLWFTTPVGMAGMAGAVLARSPLGFAISVALVGACVALAYVLSQFYGLQGWTDRRGASMGMHESVVGAGLVAGPVLGGLIATWLGLRAAFGLAAAVMVLGGLSQLIAWRYLDGTATKQRVPGTAQ